MQFWNDFEGEVIGGYPLEKLVRSEGRNAWFETEGKGGAKALISVTESLNDEKAILARLEAARDLKHENILQVTEVGQGEVKDTPLVYALMDPVEENLGDVLRERALGMAETELIARSLVTALMEMHRHGLVHGRVEPASILATGETIKVRSDCVQLASKASQNGNDWSGADFRGVGTTLCQCLTRRGARSSEDPQVRTLPAPYAEIVAKSLDGKWTSAEILRALDAPVEPVRAQEPAAMKKASAEPSLLPTDDEYGRERHGMPRRTPLYAGIAVAVLLLLVWMVVHAKSKAGGTSSGNAKTAASASHAETDASSAAIPASSSSTTKASAATSNAKPAAAKAGKNGKALAPGARVVVPLDSAALAVASKPIGAPQMPIDGPTGETPQATRTALPAGAPQGGEADVWRVVAYTYNREDQAKHKADELNTKHQGLGAEVIHPASKHGAYLVTVGGKLDRDAAIKLRLRARGMGLPRDTYAQNFKE